MVNLDAKGQKVILEKTDVKDQRVILDAMGQKVILEKMDVKDQRVIQDAQEKTDAKDLKVTPDM